MIPNALVVAFDKRVQFEPLADAPHTAFSRHGTLTIPVSEDATDEEKPGWIVDGQQRSAAIRDARVESFPICVTAFIAESDEEQRSQFILVNSAKPLPKGLIYELLPGTVGTLPPQFQIREFPARLLYRLNFQVNSPLYRLIQTPTNPDGKIKDNSILKMLENSLSDGALVLFPGPADWRMRRGRHARYPQGFLESSQLRLPGGMEQATQAVQAHARRRNSQPRIPHGYNI